MGGKSVFEAGLAFVDADLFASWQHDNEDDFRIFCRDLTIFLEILNTINHLNLTSRPLKSAWLHIFPVEYHDGHSWLKNGYRVKESFLDVPKFMLVRVFLEKASAEPILLLLVESWHFQEAVRIVTRFVVLEHFVAADIEVVLRTLREVMDAESLVGGLLP